MLGPKREDDDERILRATMEEFCDADFWRSFHAEGVVFYSWGLPRYTSICEAIKEAGLKLVVNLDTGGLLSLRVNGDDYAKLILKSNIREAGMFKGVIKSALTLARSSVPFLRDIPCLEHLGHADLIGAVSPIALERLTRFSHIYGRSDIAEKIRLIMHPISPSMRYDGNIKRKRICVVGRWGRADRVKKPELTLRVLSEVLLHNPNYDAVVIGAYDDEFETTYSNLPEQVQSRVQLMGRIANNATVSVLAESQISFCASESESFHIASAEALCCGCSVVSYESPYLPSMKYFVAENSGTLAEGCDIRLLAEALITEINAWNSGARDPEAISEIWSARVRADRVAAEIVSKLEQMY